MKFHCFVLWIGLLVWSACPSFAQKSETLLTQQPQAATDAGGTALELPSQLTSLARVGGVPESIDSLRALEAQQQRVARAARASTVSVQIGPAQGGGVIVSGDGDIMTAAHVAMRPGRKALVMLSDGRTATATTLGMNRHVDAGLIRIDPGQNDGELWPHATIGDSADLRRGMWCIAMGHPGGFDQERGPVTRVGRILDVRHNAIVTDCALIGGDSGGPLFDLSGELIAIHSRIGNDVAENLHVPIDFYQSSWGRLQAGEAWGYLEGFKPVLGVTGNAELSEARIIGVKSASPAEEAGLQSDDVVIQFGEVEISDFQSLKEAVDDTMPGELVPLTVRRGDTILRVTVEIGRADEPND